MIKKILPLAIVPLAMACNNNSNEKAKDGDSSSAVTFVTLDPGHFHAALVQKTALPGVDSNVYVYAPEGEDLQLHLKRIEGFNTRAEDPTHWNEQVYTGPDFFQKMIDEKKGNVVVMAGNNQKKTEYIFKTVDAGMNVLADKPMAINTEGFELLKQAFAKAKEKNVLLYDIMTERFEINTMLQKEFSQLKNVFGELEKGTPENPAVTKESVHYFYKFVSGSVLQRPSWFMDVSQQGEGIVDVTTHLVDLVQWECFPGQTLDYTKDVELVSARRWPTNMTLSQFSAITKQNAFPDYFKNDITNDSILNVYSNGEIHYKLRGVHAKVSVTWGYKAPEGTGDTHHSLMRGTRANLIIKQGKEENYKPVLYIEPVKKDDAAFDKDLTAALTTIQSKYPGVEIKKTSKGWQTVIPEKYNTGHEAHFGQVTEAYLQYLKEGKLPDWEIPNMITKYYITTSALDLAKKSAKK
ncbi:putative oxidoreductase C-terminal domain-containing protein [Niabella ginsengisoli]|uniref:Gfo/Idh/MocA family oxidoreductase n=1 Tax=Niabella ginsengisoli TaxID=522298 RepID=A0ABS9SI98_9BACT|nr:putative oxidoreductase C-terminal domain-containing protein [Niabella ginsengisoli]MCH5598076.1 Gfo/Idh/MocA family oxidoreductase [Niabella ginsengisoli]